MWFEAANADIRLKLFGLCRPSSAINDASTKGWPVHLHNRNTLLDLHHPARVKYVCSQPKDDGTRRRRWLFDFGPPTSILACSHLLDLSRRPCCSLLGDMRAPLRQQYIAPSGTGVVQALDDLLLVSKMRGPTEPWTVRWMTNFPSQLREPRWLLILSLYTYNSTSTIGAATFKRF